MTGPRRAILTLGTLGLSLWAAIVPGTGRADVMAVRSVAIRSFPIPTPDSDPLRIALGPDGNLWFTESSANQIGRITPRGTITEFPIPTGGAFPTDIAAGPDGAMWFTEGSVGKIGRIAPNGRILEVRFGTFNSATAITAGPDGNIWFTETSANKVWRLDLVARTFTDFDVPTPDIPPGDITAGPDGNVWFTETDGIGGSDQIGRITPDGVVTEFGNDLDRPFAITAGPDGNVWFVERGGRIGKVTPAGEFTFYLAPRGSLEDITLGPDGNLWFTEFADSRVASITVDGVITESPFLQGSLPTGISAGPRDTVWFLGFATNRVYRLTVA